MLPNEGFRVDEGRRRPADRRDGRGRRGWPRHRDPGRVRRAAGPEPGGRRRHAAAARARRQRPWLRPQHAWLGLAARRHRGQGLARRQRPERPRALLRLPGRGGRLVEGLHGARRSCSTMSTSRSAGIRRPSPASTSRSRSPASRSISPSTAAPRMRPPRRISAAARSTPSS